MMNRITIIGSAYFAGLMLLCCQSYAGVIVEPTTINLGPTSGSNVVFDGTAFNTTSLSGPPASTLTLSGFLDELGSPSNEFASISIQGVEAFGELVALPVGGESDLLFQGTVGGDFEIRDLNDDLLLSGYIGSGLISAARSNVGLSSAGGFSSDDVTFTDGSILDLIGPTGTISLSLSEIVANPTVELGFEANFTAEITVEQVPEPSTLFVFSPMLIGAFVRRRSGGCRLARRV